MLKLLYGLPLLSRSSASLGQVELALGVCLAGYVVCA